MIWHPWLRVDSSLGVGSLFDGSQHARWPLALEDEIPQNYERRRQCCQVVRALTLRSRDPGFKTCSDHSLNLILVVPGLTSQLHL